MIYSVVICCYNKLNHLKMVVGALRDIGGGHEYILSDGCSTDGSQRWAKKFGFFHKLVVQPVHKDYNLNTVRNAGVAAATKPCIVILDADCIPCKGYFSGHDAVFASKPVCISVGFTDHYDGGLENMILKDPRESHLGGQNQSLCKIPWRDAFGGNIAFPVELWKAVGGFDEEYDGCWGFDDLDFAYRATKSGYEIFGHRAALAKHCQHPHRFDKDVYNKNNKLFARKHGFAPC